MLIHAPGMGWGVYQHPHKTRLLTTHANIGIIVVGSFTCAPNPQMKPGDVKERRPHNVPSYQHRHASKYAGQTRKHSAHPQISPTHKNSSFEFENGPIKPT